MKNEIWLIWKNPETRIRYKVGNLIYDGQYTFKYINPELNDAKSKGFKCFPGFENISEIYQSDSMFPNIKTRLPNTNRSDYLSILNSYNLEKDSSEFEILKATKGRLLTDNYEFVPAFDANKVEFDIAGTRYQKDVKKIKNLIDTNDNLIFELEEDNPFDENAIKVILNKNGNKYCLGYIPRYYSLEIANLLRKKVEYSAMIQSLNFESKINDEHITAFVKLIFNK